MKQENLLQIPLEVARNKLQLSAARAGHCNRASAQHPCGIWVTSLNVLQQNFFQGFSAEEMLPLWSQERCSHYADFLNPSAEVEMGSVGPRGAVPAACLSCLHWRGKLLLWHGRAGWGPQWGLEEGMCVSEQQGFPASVHWL